jgi:hypothetical protein
MPILRFDSPAALHAAYKGLSAEHGRDGASYRSWMGGTMDEAAAKLLTGDDKLVPEAEKMLEQVGSHAHTTRPEWRPSVYGAYPVVPDALAGYPESMRHVENVGSDLAPIRLYVCTTSSAGVGHEDLTKRGIACLALAMALAAIRPVELFTITQLDGGGKATRDDHEDAGAFICVTRINSQPLDLSTACHLLTSVGVDRGITHALGYDGHGYKGGWAWGIAPNTQLSRERTRQVLDMTERDVLVAGCFITDECVQNPIGFVQRELKEFAQRNSIDADEDCA